MRIDASLFRDTNGNYAERIDNQKEHTQSIAQQLNQKFSSLRTNKLQQICYINDVRDPLAIDTIEDFIDPIDVEPRAFTFYCLQNHENDIQLGTIKSLGMKCCNISAQLGIALMEEITSCPAKSNNINKLLTQSLALIIFSNHLNNINFIIDEIKKNSLDDVVLPLIFIASMEEINLDLVKFNVATKIQLNAEAFISAEGFWLTIRDKLNQWEDIYLDMNKNKSKCTII